jgi:hypothetical protein
MAEFRMGMPYHAEPGGALIRHIELGEDSMDRRGFTICFVSSADGSALHADQFSQF